jgi:hypothetical protein
MTHSPIAPRDPNIFTPDEIALLVRAASPQSLSDTDLRTYLARLRRLLSRQRSLLRRQQEQQRRRQRHRAIDPTASARTQEKLEAYDSAATALTRESRRRARLAKTVLKEERLAAAQGNRASRRQAARVKPAPTLNPRGLNTKVTPASGVTGKVISTHQAAVQRRKGHRRRPNG